MASDAKLNKVIAQNRKARFEYFIETAFEAGIELVGTEVKSIRMGGVNLKESYAQVVNGEVLVYSMHISPYEKGNVFNKDPLRVRKLLLHRSEINRLIGFIKQKGYTLIPLSMYMKNGRVKIELAVAKGKQVHDKRHDIAEKDAKRDIERQFRAKEY